MKVWSSVFLGAVAAMSAAFVTSAEANAPPGRYTMAGGTGKRRPRLSGLGRHLKSSPQPILNPCSRS